MADVLRLLPLLLLATLLLLLVVLLRACVAVRGPRGRRRRQVAANATMEMRESSAGQQRRAIEFSIHERPVSGHRPPAYDPTLYSHLPLHQQPLPPDPEEEWVDDLPHTLPLGSRSTQEWMERHCQQREAGTSHQSYSAMLEEGIVGGDTEIVDLDSGLSTGTPGVGANTCASNHLGATTLGQTCVGRVGVAGVGGRSSRVGGTGDGCRQAPSICGGVGPAGDAPRAVLPTRSATPSPALRQRAAAPAANTSTSPPEEMGRQAWASNRQQMRPATADNITNGVSWMRVGNDADADDTRRASGEESPDSHCEEEPEDAEDLDIRPVGDLQKRLVEVGMKRTTDDIGKKWDNLFQQYKNVQRYQNASGGKNFFILTPALRTEEGFSFRMDERVYLEIDNMSQGNKTIYLDNLPDTSARGAVQMPGDSQRQPSIAGESSVGGDVGDGNDEDGGSARKSGFSAGSTGGAGKRKNMRQQTFDAIAEVMEKHAALMADTVEGASKRQCSILERQCDILEREIDAQKRHYEASDEANRMMCTVLLEIAKAIRERS
ncbi:hypothetical protein CBR_g42054 [Chara braunii]|uniref:Uncharacterized protein n=1 Tax=Chara braunii TaxID=69332 RepID=A0A388LX29_CHABU|nr:hypothetical protein CBR_g42054 [Chara braunii]|eukprot:GBG86769.1 hypothetical protein CBR_g42054 [Chara braunii]